jgi:hypothetical protein
MDLPLLIFDWKNLRKPPENIQKPPETSMKPSENFKNSGKLRNCQYSYLAHNFWLRRNTFLDYNGRKIIRRLFIDCPNRV